MNTMPKEIDLIEYAEKIASADLRADLYEYEARIIRDNHGPLKLAEKCLADAERHRLGARRLNEMLLANTAEAPGL